MRAGDSANNEKAQAGALHLKTGTAGNAIETFEDAFQFGRRNADAAIGNAQRDVFIEQMRIARDAGKPIVIHTREAWDDTISFLREHWTGPGGIMHCFSEGPERARQALDIGFYLSFGGIVTFPKAREVQESARMAPADRILLETDAPYLAPVPRRGKRNEPAFMMETARKLAELRGETVESIEAATTANFRRLCLRYTQ